MCQCILQYYVALCTKKNELISQELILCQVDLVGVDSVGVDLVGVDLERRYRFDYGFAGAYLQK